MDRSKLIKLKYFLYLFIFESLSACANSPLSNFDFDFRGNSFDTSDAALQATQSRPKANELGVINYPTYQVAIARRGDTIETMARRLGQDESDLARYNGLAQGQRLRNGEVLALPKISTNIEQDFAEGEELSLIHI